MNEPSAFRLKFAAWLGPLTSCAVKPVLPMLALVPGRYRSRCRAHPRRGRLAPSASFPAGVPYVSPRAVGVPPSAACGEDTSLPVTLGVAAANVESCATASSTVIFHAGFAFPGTRYLAVRTTFDFPDFLNFVFALVAPSTLHSRLSLLCRCLLANFHLTVYGSGATANVSR